MKSLKLALLALTMLSAKTLLASDLQMSLDESEVKEEVARSLGLNAQQIDIYPAAIEYAKTDVKNVDGVNLKGRFFITWAVRDTFASSDTMTYTNNGITLNTNTSSDDSKNGNIANSVKIGYQIFENLGIEGSYERSSSTMGVSSIASGQTLGKVSSLNTVVPEKIQNDFQTVKIGLTTNANLIDAKSFRLDLVGGVNAGMIQVDSTYRSDGDIYKGAIGYTYGGEIGVRMIHKSGIYVQTGVGINNKVIAPMTYKDGSHSQFNGSDKYVFINVGYSFGGKNRR